jgi:hypothetical protein
MPGRGSESESGRQLGGVRRAHETITEDELDDGLLAEEERADSVDGPPRGIAADIEDIDDVEDGEGADEPDGGVVMSEDAADGWRADSNDAPRTREMRGLTKFYPRISMMQMMISRVNQMRWVEVAEKGARWATLCRFALCSVETAPSSLLDSRRGTHYHGHLCRRRLRRLSGAVATCSRLRSCGYEQA